MNQFLTAPRAIWTIADVLTSSIWHECAGGFAVVAVFASLGQVLGYPTKNVTRSMDIATLVWLVNCCVALVLPAQIIRALADSNDQSQSRLRAAAIAMMIAGMTHIAVYRYLVQVLGSHTRLLLLAPGILWIVAGLLSLKVVIHLTSSNMDKATDIQWQGQRV